MATFSPASNLTAADVRAAFPRLVGPIVCGWQIDSRAVVVEQCRDAFAALVDGEYVACCPTWVLAMRAASKHMARVAA